MHLNTGFSPLRAFCKSLSISCRTLDCQLYNEEPFFSLWAWLLWASLVFPASWEVRLTRSQKAGRTLSQSWHPEIATVYLCALPPQGDTSAISDQRIITSAQEVAGVGKGVLAVMDVDPSREGWLLLCHPGGRTGNKSSLEDTTAIRSQQGSSSLHMQTHTHIRKNKCHRRRMTSPFLSTTL